MRAAALIAIVLVAGCQDQTKDVSQSGGPRNSIAAQNPQAAPEKSATMNPVAAVQSDLPGSKVPTAATGTIEVQLTEYGIQMPDTIPAGHQRFHVANAGKIAHSFQITGANVQTKLPHNLMSGDTTEFAADLQPGTYTVFCPVDGHRGKGMEKTINVR